MEHQIYIRCWVFDISALIGQNLRVKSKWWVLIIACKWAPNVEVDFDVCVDSRHCLTGTSKSHSTLGTFSGKCPVGYWAPLSQRAAGLQSSSTWSKSLRPVLGDKMQAQGLPHLTNLVNWFWQKGLRLKGQVPPKQAHTWQRLFWVKKD